MGKSFQKINACYVGSFGEVGEKIPQWLRANGGTYSKDMNPDVTHLIATESAFKRNVEAVQAAKRMKHVKIVSYDWLEDSLMSKTRRPKREGPYLCEKLWKRKTKKKATKAGKKGKSAKSRKGGAVKSPENFRKGSRAVVDDMARDQETSTTYCATLFRPTLMTGRNEKYQLKLYESNAEPHVYATYVKYSRIGKSATELVAPRGSGFDLAMAAYKKFFKIKTGKDWDDRFDGSLPEARKDPEGNALPPDEGWFRHELPTGLLASLFMPKVPAAASLLPCSSEENGQSPDRVQVVVPGLPVDAPEEPKERDSGVALADKGDDHIGGEDSSPEEDIESVTEVEEDWGYYGYDS
ncbi:BRCT domain protein [Paecilomyces variotii No. 5]|uniref:BRCT domain protein n=1 Tax=Byssochlamys spectabilis (strain No. 5 / NBRC 109023) TaxID=1356009 RepID=V5I4E5_BYSSN|nr:BRCT domain protein [Paecilomyces variotii No. 5]